MVAHHAVVYHTDAALAAGAARRHTTRNHAIMRLYLMVLHSRGMWDIVLATIIQTMPLDTTYIPHILIGRRYAQLRSARMEGGIGDDLEQFRVFRATVCVGGV